MWMIFIYNDVKFDIKQLNMSERCRHRLQGHEWKSYIQQCRQQSVWNLSTKTMWPGASYTHERELWSMAMKHMREMSRDNFINLDIMNMIMLQGSRSQYVALMWQWEWQARGQKLCNRGKESHSDAKLRFCRNCSSEFFLQLTCLQVEVCEEGKARLSRSGWVGVSHSRSPGELAERQAGESENGVCAEADVV